jgi:hypothetical protein
MSATARIDTPGREHWRIEEDDYGDPMVINRHVDAEFPAHVISRYGQRQLAQCSTCMQYIELVGMRAATRSAEARSGSPSDLRGRQRADDPTAGGRERVVGSI